MLFLPLLSSKAVLGTKGRTPGRAQGHICLLPRPGVSRERPERYARVPTRAWSYTLFQVERGEEELFMLQRKQAFMHAAQTL